MTSDDLDNFDHFLKGMYNLWEKSDDLVNNFLEDLRTALNIGTEILEGDE